MSTQLSKVFWGTFGSLFWGGKRETKSFLLLSFTQIAIMRDYDDINKQRENPGSIDILIRKFISLKKSVRALGNKIKVTIICPPLLCRKTLTKDFVLRLLFLSNNGEKKLTTVFFFEQVFFAHSKIRGGGGGGGGGDEKHTGGGQQWRRNKSLGRANEKRRGEWEKVITGKKYLWYFRHVRTVQRGGRELDRPYQIQEEKQKKRM